MKIRDISKVAMFAAAAVSLTFAGGAIAPAKAASTKECSEPATKPNSKFTESYEQTPSCNSNSDVNRTETVVKNPSGNQPPGQQP